MLILGLTTITYNLEIIAENMSAHRYLLHRFRWYNYIAF